MSQATRILVTGGAGYVGSHACKLLARAGFEPVTYDNLSRGHSSLVRFGPLIRGDIRNRAKLRDALEQVRPAACLHFAALAYVGESIAAPELYYDNNVHGTLCLLQELRAADIGRLVFSSTCAVYGQCETLPIDETAPKRPLSPYGRSKLVVEDMLADFEAAHGLRSLSLRYFNACGADPDGEIGELHDPEPHIIPRTFMAATGVIPWFEVFGDDYPTPDGTAVRDYTHVMDLAAAHVAAVTHLLDGGGSDAMNLGIGRGYSVRQILGVSERVTGRAIPVMICPRRPGDPAKVVADAGKALRVLGFQPRHVELDEIVGTAWQWAVKTRVRAPMVSSA
jgi:UDP-arabinose 4-epimerase